MLAIVLVLAGEDIDDTSARAIGTAAAVAIYSLTAAAGNTLAQRRPELAALGYLVIAASVVAALTGVWAIWADDGGEGLEKTALDLLVVSIAGGHASVLLGGRRDGEGQTVELLRLGTVLALLLLATLGVAAISSDSGDSAKGIAVVAILYLLGTVLLALARRAGPPAAGRPPASTTAVAELDHVTIAITDWERSNAFYRDLLGAEVLELASGRTAYRLGRVHLNAVGPGSEPSVSARKPIEPGGADICFAWPGPIEDAIAHLDAHGITHMGGPNDRVGAGGTGRSVYLNDPDGSLIELISYEA